MRFEGVMKKWDDDRGFGFIEPTQGGQEIFVHIKSFTERMGRPQVGHRVVFEVELGKDGKKRAKAVRTVRLRRTQARRHRVSPAHGFGTASYFALPAFAVVYMAAAILWRVPGWVAIGYGAASLICFACYAEDKSAARTGRWRMRESTLLLLGLFGGWPGAIVAQQVLRHKSRKASFRAAFWATVVLNVAAFLVLACPTLRQWILLTSHAG